MKKASIFISTAALMAGTACGVWAETNETVSTSFDRAERSVYDSNVNYRPDMTAEVDVLYTAANSGYASPSSAYAPSGDATNNPASQSTNQDTNQSTTGNTVNNSSSTSSGSIAGSTGSMGSLTPSGTGATEDSGRSLNGNTSPSDSGSSSSSGGTRNMGSGSSSSGGIAGGN